MNMAMQLNTNTWQKSRNLDPDRPVLHKILDIPSKTNTLQHRKNDYTTVISDIPSKTSFLYSQKLKQSLLESKKAFLNLSLEENKPEDGLMEEKSIVLNQSEPRRVPSKKISFKIKKTCSIYRRNSSSQPKMTTISANTVAELTRKFNQMVNEKNTILEEPKFKKLVKRVNSLKRTERDLVRKTSFNVKLVRKPSVKDDIIILSKPSVSRKLSVKNNKSCIRAKIGYLETPHVVPKPEEKPTRPTSLPVKPFTTNNKDLSPTSGTVKATIEIFERKTSLPKITTEELPKLMPKPKIPERKPKTILKKVQQTTKTEPEKTETIEEVQIINIPVVLPKRSESLYETLHLKKVTPVDHLVPNSSFLWRSQDKSPTSPYKPLEIDKDKELDVRKPKECSLDQEWEVVYDSVDIRVCELKDKEEAPEIPPRPPPKKPPNEPKKVTYEYDYELVEKTDDGYEYCASPTTENIYEILPTTPVIKRSSLIQQEPLPPRPPSRSSYCTIQNGEEISNCYESIYTADSEHKKGIDTESNYESIYGCPVNKNRLNKESTYNGSNQSSTGSNRDSIISEQQSNSLYGRSLTNFCLDSVYNGKANSDLSVSDRSDDWVDMTDNEEDSKTSGIIILRGKQKSKKSGWLEHCREQFSKTPRKLSPDPGVDSESDHHYESLYTGQNGNENYCDDYDSFDSDSEYGYDSRGNLNDSGLDIANNRLPEPPQSGQYVFTRLAATAGKHMKKLRRNWSLTKNDISRSLSRMTKRKSRPDLYNIDISSKEESTPSITVVSTSDISDYAANQSNMSYQNVDISLDKSDSEKSKSLTRKGFLNKFRRSMSMSTENASELTTNLNKPNSTFYLTDTIDVDDIEKAEEANPDSGVSLSPVPTSKVKPNVIRPQSPPPPVPPKYLENNKKEKRERKASTWYEEAGLFRNDNLPKRSTTFWYAEVGLYQTSTSTPSTSSAENSGSNVINYNSNLSIDNNSNKEDKVEEYYNLKNGNYYNSSTNSIEKKDESALHLQLQDEPLYQFYDAAVLESVCNDGTSDFDSDGYEEVGHRQKSNRPSAMELVSPKKNSLPFTRTLWCEIPEVIQSSVLSTLSPHQKRLQEAKFEILTSEASYLNSLNLLCDHFISNLVDSNLLYDDEKDVLFSKIKGVRDCSEKLLHDLEKCWQDNILLQGVCDIVQKHAEENFYVYVTYCGNQILIDDALKKLKDRSAFQDSLKYLEASQTCQSLTLYSFLMLPMQRITRWPLLVDAVLKRLSQQDSEYLTCQYALATLNKIVSQCNEAARTKERETEMKKIANQLEFHKGVKPIKIVEPNRWLIRSGLVTHVQPRNDETKLTFGKRFNKVPLHLFLFNDMLLVCKLKSDNLYNVIHYCPRNLLELSSSDLISLPVKDSQGKNLIFLTLLENQDEKTVEFMLSCSSESDRERWVEALSPLKSENPDETLYECWDCPQVTAIHNYIASQPDELPVVRGDVINVLRKMADGWYHGERIRDGQTGWFPANYTVEIANPHVRARNLKQRYRLLAFSETYLKSK